MTSTDTSAATDPDANDIDPADPSYPDDPVDPADPTDPRPRFAGRPRVVLTVVLVVVLAVVVIWVVAFSSLLGVRSVDVRGNDVLAAGAVAQAADVPHGQPLVRVDTTAIARRVEKLSVVRSAEVDTSFPSTVVITVHERTPVGYVHDDSSGRDRLVDATGLQYLTVRRAPDGLPRFSLPTGSGARPSAVAVASVAAALPAKVRRSVTSIDAFDPSAITVVMTKGRIVQWGRAERNALKAAVLPALLASGRDTGNDHIDVSDPVHPYTH